MRWFTRSALALLAVLLLALCALGIYVWRSFPALDGEHKAPGLLAGVRLVRDATDVTHVYAASARDAYWAIGYVHAQERSWQIEFNRRVMHGELSEVFGAATLEVDRLMRVLGIARAAERQWQALPAEARQALQAYADGVNAFHQSSSQALPPEFHVLQVRPGVWTPQDSVGWSLMMALDLGGNWGTEFARLSALQKLSTAQLWQLLPPYPGEAPATGTDLAALYRGLGVFRTEGAGAAKTAALGPPAQPGPPWFGLGQAGPALAWASELGNVEGKGSNNWVVAGSRSASGKPLLANDPHLGLSAPAIWYFAALHAPGLEVVGATLPGLPFVVLGHTARVAWGFTNTGPDVQDLYLEQINPANPAQYRTPTGWADFVRRDETIRVKGQADVALVVRETRHGPVLSDAQQSHAEVLDLQKFVLALRWSALDADNQTVAAAIAANSAGSVGAMTAAYASYHSPMQNALIADVDGSIAFRAVGKVPLRRADNDLKGMAPAPGWDPRYDWSGWLPYEHTPQDNGEKGWIATANQRVTPEGYPYFIGQDWAPPPRHERIVQLLRSTERHGMDSFAAMQADQRSLATLTLLPVLQRTALVSTSSNALLPAVRQLLQGFDGVMRADSPAALVFAAWADELARGLIAPKLGPERFKALYGRRHFRQAVEGIMARNDASWCAPLGCEAQSAAALDRALERLSGQYGSDPAAWRWGRAHAAVSSHQPFSRVKPLAGLFEVRADTGGDTFTVNVGHYWLGEAQPFVNRHAASMRAIYDLADLENSRFIYQTGQSGLVFSSRYRDMAGDWAAVTYRPLKLQAGPAVHQATLVP